MLREDNIEPGKISKCLGSEAHRASAVRHAKLGSFGHLFDGPMKLMSISKLNFHLQHAHILIILFKYFAYELDMFGQRCVAVAGR